MKKEKIENLIEYARHLYLKGERLREISEELEELLDKEPTIESVIFDTLGVPKESDECCRDAHWMTIFKYYSGEIKTAKECEEELKNMKYDI